LGQYGTSKLIKLNLIFVIYTNQLELTLRNYGHEHDKLTEIPFQTSVIQNDTKTTLKTTHFLTKIIKDEHIITNKNEKHDIYIIRPNDTIHVNAQHFMLHAT